MIGTNRGVVAIIDDDLAVLDALKFLLEASAYTVASYPSAADFLEDRLIHPACLILDQHMPRMTGLELVAKMRIEGAPVPVLLMTAMLSPEIIVRAAQLGIERVLDKPPTEDDLLGFVEEFCYKK
jgi:two-component system response regulator FixJ